MIAAANRRACRVLVLVVQLPSYRTPVFLLFFFSSISVRRNSRNKGRFLLWRFLNLKTNSGKQQLLLLFLSLPNCAPPKKILMFLETN